LFEEHFRSTSRPDTVTRYNITRRCFAMAEDVSRSGHGMPGTRWSEVDAAREADTEPGQLALESLLSRYRPALVAHLRAKFGLPLEDAEDVLHGFIEKKILTRNFIATAEPSRGRFRTYLLSSLDRFAISELRRQRALKRRPGADLIPLDEVNEAELPTDDACFESPYEVVWSQVVIAGALLNMHNECEREGRTRTWEIFLSRLLEPELGGEEPVPYDELIRHHGLDSPSNAFNLLNTAKRMFLRHMGEVVAEYACNGEEVEEELAHLKRRLIARSSSRSG
jgi:RNA polymerase sigma-70 factor (ECF subfamily)